MDYDSKSRDELVMEIRRLRQELEFFRSSPNITSSCYGKNGNATCQEDNDRESNALRECQEAFEMTQELAHMGTWEQNFIMGKTTWSRNTYALFGLEPFSIAPSSEYFDSHVHPEDLGRIYELLNEINETGEKVEYQFRMRMPDDSERWFHSRIEPFFESGKLAILKGTNLDITELKKKEDEIISKNEWLNAIMHATPDYILVYDIYGYCREYYGNAPENLTAIEKNLPGSHISALLGEKKANEILEWIVPSILNDQAINFEHQMMLDGKEYYFDVRIRSLDKERFLVLARDNTSSKKALKEIKKLSMAVDQSPLSIVITDLEGNIEYVNPWFTKITGYSTEEVLGLNPRILKSGAHEREFYENMWNDLHSGKRWSGSIQNRKKNGELFWESAIISPVKDETGEITHFISIKEDITEKVKAEQQLKESLYTRDKLFSIIAHDLRGPIGNFIPMVDILSESENLDETFRKELLEGMKKTAITTFDLLENLLNWAKFQSKSIRLKPVKFDISDAIRDMAELYVTSAALKSISLKIETAGHFNVIADKDSVKLVIRNLLNNAIKFTGNNGTIIISDRDEGDKIAVEIKDTGVGMTPEVLEKLFTPNTLHSTYGTDNEKGSGLGLILCKEFIEKNGGTIQVQSTPDEGSRFIFTLNKYGTKGTKIKKQVTPVPINNELLRGRKILLVEDDAFSQLYGKNLLQQWNVQIEVANNGKEAIEILKTRTFDIVLMDTEMPVMDGYSTMEVIRQELLLTVPVIAFTANIGEIAIEKAEKCGFNDYMNKPGNPGELFSRIVHLLGIVVPFPKNGESQKKEKEKMENYADTRKLKNALGNDPTMTKEMIAKFLEITPAYYREMLTSYEKGDHLQLKQTSHKLKSSIHLLASKAMTENIKLINDHAANPEHKQTLKTSMEFFRDAYPLLCDELQAELILLN